MSYNLGLPAAVLRYTQTRGRPRRGVYPLMPSESRKAKCAAALRTVAASAVCIAVEISATWWAWRSACAASARRDPRRRTTYRAARACCAASCRRHRTASARSHPRARLLRGVRSRSIALSRPPPSRLRQHQKILSSWRPSRSSRCATPFCAACRAHGPRARAHCWSHGLGLAAVCSRRGRWSTARESVPAACPVLLCGGPCVHAPLHTRTKARRMGLRALRTYSGGLAAVAE